MKRAQSLSDTGASWLPATEQSDAPFTVSSVSWGPSTSVFDELAVARPARSAGLCRRTRADPRAGVESVGGAAGHRRGQGIDAVTAALSHPVTLTERELQTLAFRLGIHDLPVVLAVRHRHPTIDGRDTATNRATQELVSRNLIVDDQVHPDLVSVLRALQRPDRELAMRLVTPDGTARISAVRRGSRGVLARRIGDDISLRTVGESGELCDMAAALLAELPQAKPAEIQPVGAPLSEMSECLSGTHDSVGLRRPDPGTGRRTKGSDVARYGVGFAAGLRRNRPLRARRR